MSHAESIYEKLQRWCKIGSDLIWRIIYFPTPTTVGLWCGRIPEKIDSDFHNCLKCELQKCARNSIMAFWAKGQLISEWIYELIVSSKIRTKSCKDFCPDSQGRNPCNFSFDFWKKRWVYKFILKLTDL